MSNSRVVMWLEESVEARLQRGKGIASHQLIDFIFCRWRFRRGRHSLLRCALISTGRFQFCSSIAKSLLVRVCVCVCVGIRINFLLINYFGI